MTDREQKVLELIRQYGGIDGEHHKQWVLDQIVYIITGAGHDDWVKEFEYGDDGEKTYEWDIGVAP